MGPAFDGGAWSPHFPSVLSPIENRLVPLISSRQDLV